MKSLTKQALARMNLELIRKPAGSTHRAELSGLTFVEFLGLFLATKDLSSFVFVQVGGFDGMSNDPVHDFASKLQLKGLVIEPQPAAFQSLTANYNDCRNVILENVAISTEDGERPFYTIRKDLDFLQYVNQAASFNPEHTQRLLKKHITKEASAATRKAFYDLKLSFKDCIEPQPVKTATLRTLLDKNGIARYDFLQVDTEGFDYEVLKIAGLEAHTPGLINYEHEHLTPKDRVASWEYLRGLGYRLFTHEGDTSAFLPASYLPR